jgi:hypothetical protein
MAFLDKLKKNVAAAVNSAASALGANEKSYVFEEIPATLDELKARPEADLKDGAGVAALAIIALNVYAVDQNTGVEMLNFLRGPAGPLSPMDLSFLKDRFSDKDYVPRSYFNGAAPENNYEPSEPYTLVIKESAHSRDTEKEGVITYYVHSGGADSDRPISVRTKPSTGEWFIRSYEGILAGIRVPDAANPWA